MKILNLIITTYFVAISSMVIADTNGFISIPASAFSEQDSQSSTGDSSYKGNDSGTSRDFKRKLFAPINLPHDGVVTSLTCGSKPKGGFLTSFTLRRNEPQQANVDMATVVTSKGGTLGAGLLTYQIINTKSVISPLINNAQFNYYIVAASISPAPDGPVGLICPDRCGNVNFCSVGYTIVERGSGDGAGKVTID